MAFCGKVWHNLAMDNKQNLHINWFPGHMNASIKALERHIKQCDVILYVLDARCPKSCLNPSFESILTRKPVLFVLNKADLAPKGTFRGISIDSIKSGEAQKVIRAARKLLPTRTRIHAMVIGVPNCGKSTLINNFVGKSKAKTADRPGVTRAPQWAEASGNLYLLDTPGILWPNLEDQHVARNLAFVGSIKDEVLDTAQLARELLAVIKYPGTLEDFAKKRGHIIRGGEVDLPRTSAAVLHEFRAGKFGKFNLDDAE